ncbi:MAG TPA: PVC-type heme-binding CxxCH protein [Steroidobacteraceae bacterium]|nr:PVC-type heme-binding CxxCH protein [Steroidobacteraceae bacterium]
MKLLRSGSAALAASLLPCLTVPAAEPAAEPAPTVVPLTMFTVPDDLEVTLWAQSPMLRNPTNIDIDAAGRIWVTEGVNYRRHNTRDAKGDRVVVLEDTDHDGRADRSTVFVQEPTLVAPLGIAVIGNKVLVSNAPDLIVYTDVDGDLRYDPAIDKREVLLSGFDGRNHDHALHSVTVGPDGRWYFSAGNAGSNFTDRGGRTFRIGSIYDPRGSGAIPVFGSRPPDYAGARSDDGHVYVGGFAARMRPDGSGVEIIGHNFRNSYEQAVTSFGDVFQNDNDDPPACRTTFLMEYGNTGYFSRDGKRNWNADRRPGQSIPVAEWRQDDPGVIPSGDVYGGGAPTGIVVNEGDGLGRQWRGLLISAEAARNTLFGYFPKPQGAGFRLDRIDFLTTNREQRFAGTDFKGGKTNSEIQTFFRPSDVAIGPDGALYVADWFDPRVGGHDDKDDTASGAIYRIAPKGFRSVIPAHDFESLDGQVAALKSPAVNVRGVAAARLAQRGAAAVPAVEALLRDDNEFVRARAVWLLARLGDAGLARVERLLADADPQVRIAAYRALRRESPAFLRSAATLARDASPAVRREVALSLRDVSFADSRDVLLALASGYDGADRSYLEAWGIGATGKEDALYEALAATRSGADATRWPKPYSDLVWRLTPRAAVPEFLARARAASLPPGERDKAMTALGFVPTREAANAMIELAASRPFDIRRNPAFRWLLNQHDTIWKGFGIEAELKSRGIYDPDTVTLSEVVVPPAPAESALPPVAEIAKLRGDAKRGAVTAGACLMCHSIGGKGVDYAPVLDGFARRQPKEVVIGAIVRPSDDIAHGYEGWRLVLKDGRKIDGILLAEGDPTIIQSTGGLTQMVPAGQIAERRWFGRSLMMSADQLGLSAQQVADVAAYLVTSH